MAFSPLRCLLRPILPPQQYQWNSDWWRSKESDNTHCIRNSESLLLTSVLPLTAFDRPGLSFSLSKRRAWVINETLNHNSLPPVSFLVSPLEGQHPARDQEEVNHCARETMFVFLPAPLALLICSILQMLYQAHHSLCFIWKVRSTDTTKKSLTFLTSHPTIDTQRPTLSTLVFQKRWQGFLHISTFKFKA